MHPGSTALKNQSRRKKGVDKVLQMPKVHRKKLRWAFFFIRLPGAKMRRVFLSKFCTGD
jgi:uncharacterized Rossmann fold enzyme